jgi:nucleoside-diphosphate-sugar epimerase
MRVLITGGTGFTGSHLTRRYLELGHEVVVVDNQEGLFFDELRERGADIRIGSVTDTDLVDAATEGCELVHHVAAMFRKVNLPKRHYYEVNVEGTRNVMERALKHGVRRVVYCSTCGVHGNVGEGAAGEDSPIAPADYYQETKYLGEEVARRYLDQGLQVSILRPAAIYGPGDPERFLFLYRMARKGRFLMFGDGRTHYHPLYIDNLVQAFELAAEVDAAVGQAYLVADETYSELNDLVAEIGASMGIDVRIVHLPFWPLWTAAALTELLYKPLPADPPLFRRRVDWFRQNRAFQIDKAKRELGYTPAVGLEEGLARTGEWYQQEGYL